MGGIYVNCTDCSGIGYIDLTKSEANKQSRIDIQQASPIIDSKRADLDILPTQHDIDVMVKNAAISEMNDRAIETQINSIGGYNPHGETIKERKERGKPGRKPGWNKGTVSVNI